MTSLKQKLPPLSALITFEAAARHLSFTEAGKELHVTQAAVSRQIKTLESDLDTILFERKHRSLSLTMAAEKLLQAVTTGFEHIASAVEDVKLRPSEEYFTIAGSIAFTTLKLNPLLTEFQTLYPDTDVRLLAVDSDIDLQAESVDLLFSCGDYSQHKGVKSTYLFEDEVFPVCSEQYLREHSELNRPEDLLKHNLLHLDAQHWNNLSWEAIDWKFWLKSQGVEPLLPHHGLTMNNYPLLLQAAINGQGIALGWQHLVSDLVEQGSLIRPIHASYRSQRGYYLVESSQKPLSSQTEVFRNWVLDQLLV